MAMRRASEVSTRCSSGPMFERADHGGGQQIESDHDVAARGLEPVAHFLGDHQGAELNERRAGQPGRLHRNQVFGNVRQQHADKAPLAGTHVRQCPGQPHRPGR